MVRVRVVEGAEGGRQPVAQQTAAVQVGVELGQMRAQRRQIGRASCRERV